MRLMVPVLSILILAPSLHAQGAAMPVEIHLLTEGADARFSGRELRLKVGDPRRSDDAGLITRAPSIVLADLNKGDVIIELTDSTKLVQIEVTNGWGGRIEAEAKRLVVRATPDGMVVFAASTPPPNTTPRRPRE